MDAYLEEELFDLFTFCIKEPQSPDLPVKRKRAEEIGLEIYADGGTDALENMFFALENRIKEETGTDPRPYRAWWNGLSTEWKY
ncbi:MAG: hypothetical protein ACRD99_00395 [Nitrososphaera sp.]